MLRRLIRRIRSILSKPTLLFILLLTTSTVHATHIVGGELNYTYLGDNNYRLELKLYKDCGTSIVPFDNPATIYVYGSDDLFLTSFEIPLVERDTLEAAFDDPCLLVPPDVCVDFARYELVVNLPAIPDDYTLAYIRCCRNATILNAEGIDEFGNPLPPDLIGATYAARIPASPVINSNPVFNEFPPIIVCSGQPITVDQSAFDADGDQLVYSLCTPNVGGSLVNVFGDPLTERPPFEEIIWVEPFGLDNIMGGDPPLMINPTTGLLTGQAPFAIGQFVVGVCVQEFRNGILLSENKRDFQFNIADCQEAVVSDYEIEPEPFQDTLDINLMGTVFEYVLLCDTNLSVQFYNLTEGSNDVIWDFGDGSPFVLEENPIHIFPDTGFYEVSLFGAPGDICSDTLQVLINVQLQRSNADFSFSPPQCYDPVLGLQFTDETSSPEMIETWTWDFGDGTSSTQPDPIHFYNSDDTFSVALEIIENNGCRSFYDTSIVISRLYPFDLSDTLSLCNGDSVMLDLEIEGNHQFIWSPPETLSDPFIQNPKAFPSANTTYTVRIFTEAYTGDTCMQEDRVTVLTDVGNPVIVSTTESFQCENPVQLSVGVESGIGVIWSTEGNFINVIGEEAEIDYQQEQPIESYFVMATDFNCISVDTISLERHNILIEHEDLIICRGDEVAIRPVITSLDTSFIYSWSPPGGTIDNSVPEYVFSPEIPTTVSLEVMNSTGCSTVKDVLVDISTISGLNAMATPSVITGEQEIQFQASDIDIFDYSWQPAVVFNDPAINDPVATVSETSEFIVTVTDLNGCPHNDTVVVVLLEACDEANIFIPSAFSPNGDDLNDIFRIQSDIAESISLAIYDRYGGKVYESTDISQGWDGSFHGRNLGNDVFGYILKVLCIGGERFVKSGNVTLVR